MEAEKSYPKMLIWAVAAMLLLGLTATLVVNAANRARSRIPVWGELSEFEFIDAYTGKPWGLQQMQGKLSVVDFIFTNCESVCPVMAINMTDLYDLYAHSDKVQFVSISVDPVRDSLAVLRNYADGLGVNDGRWIFLNAPLEQVTELCEKQFMLPAESLPMGHTTKFILVDQFGRIRSYHEGINSESMTGLKNNIRQLAGELE